MTDSLSSFVDKADLVTKLKFLSGMMNNHINSKIRISWKYACLRDNLNLIYNWNKCNAWYLDVVSTSTLFINDVSMNGSSSRSFADWKSVIDQILASNEKSSFKIKDCPSGQEQRMYAPERSQCCFAGFLIIEFIKDCN